ncbi:MAG TPA: hypothetical protein VMA72_01140 [Streptosporangiaceae bacterium]|nr:hypothetical protein [Streptosporangiaceae bacterium]
MVPVPLGAAAGEPDTGLWVGAMVVWVGIAVWVGIPVCVGIAVWVFAAADVVVLLEVQAAAARQTPSAAVAAPISLGFMQIISRSDYLAHS